MKDRIEQFELVEEITRSSITSVFKAYQSNLDRWVLLKQLHPHLTREEDIVQRFEREAKAAARIKHENIVDIYDYGQWEDTYYIAMEYIQGTSLKALLNEHGPLPIDIAVAILQATLQGLGYAHTKGVFHRDMKPANILISAEGTVKITDFGLALISDYPSITAQDGIVGTPAYMSPEQANGQELDGRSDIFSLGLTFYEMLAGKRAFDGGSFSECISKLLTEEPPKIGNVRKDVPKAISDILDGMLKKNLSKRYQACDEVLHDLELCSKLSGEIPSKDNLATFMATPQRARRPEIIQKAQPAKKGKRRSITAFAAISLLVMIVGGYVLLNRNPIEKTDDTIPLREVSVDEPPVSERRDTIDSLQFTSLTDTESFPMADTQSSQDQKPKELKTQAGELPSSSLSENENPPQAMAQEESAVGDQIEKSKNDIITRTTPEEIQYGLLEIHCHPWADVYIDNERIDTTPLREAVTLQTGIHKIALVNPDFPPYFETIHIEPNETRRIDISLFSIVGFIDVKAHPWASVFIDGDSIDTTPFIRPYMLSAGIHTLRLENPNFGIFEEQLEVATGETLRVDRDLTVRLKD